MPVKGLLNIIKAKSPNIRNNMNILEQIKSEIKSYKEDEIELSPGVKFSQYKTLKKAYSYKSSKFEGGDRDPLTKKKKVFYQISRFRARVVAKMLDFDIKDLRCISNKIFDLIAQLKAYLLEKKIKNWAKENDFAIVLNDIVQSVAEFGSAVVKKPKGKPAEVKDLKYIYLDPSVRYIKDSSFIIEEKELRRDEINDKKDIWNNVNLVLDSFKSKENDKIKIYERYGIIEKNGKFEKRMIIVTDANGGYKDGIELFNEKIEEYPYLDFHINKVDGRWLGIGTYEELFDSQIRENTIANQKARALELSSRQIFWTPDDLFARNILGDLDTGDILKTPGGINPVQVETRGLAEFTSEEARYDLLADRLTFTYDAIRGETLPSTTPATNAMLQNQNALSVFEQLRENLAVQIVNFIQDLVLPDIIKDKGGEHIMRFISKLTDLEKFDKLFTEHITQQTAYKYLMNTGFYPEDNDVIQVKDSILEKLKNGGLVRSVKLPAGFFRNISDVDIIIDNESRNIPLQSQNLEKILTIIMSNPMALDNPLVKSIIYSYAEMVGISPIELENAEANNKQINEQNIQNIASSQGGMLPSGPNPRLPAGAGVAPRVLR